MDKEPINKGYPQSQPQAMVYLGIIGSCLVCTEDVEMVRRVMMRQFDGTFGDPDLVQPFADLEKKCTGVFIFNPHHFCSAIQQCQTH